MIEAKHLKKGVRALYQKKGQQIKTVTVIQNNDQTKEVHFRSNEGEFFSENYKYISTNFKKIL
jgi:hypothetical protein